MIPHSRRSARSRGPTASSTSSSVLRSIGPACHDGKDSVPERIGPGSPSAGDTAQGWLDAGGSAHDRHRECGARAAGGAPARRGEPPGSSLQHYWTSLAGEHAVVAAELADTPLPSPRSRARHTLLRSARPDVSPARRRRSLTARSDTAPGPPVTWTRDARSETRDRGTVRTTTTPPSTTWFSQRPRHRVWRQGPPVGRPPPPACRSCACRRVASCSALSRSSRADWVECARTAVRRASYPGGDVGVLPR